MMFGPAFHIPTIFRRVTQLNSKHGSTPKVTPTYWKPIPKISQHRRQRVPRPVKPKIKCTEPIFSEQQQHLSGILSYLYETYYTYKDPISEPTT